MILRRRKGATLGLVAVCIMIIAVVGIAAYFLSKMLGGGREIANATDAGTLNVAKHIIRDSRVPTPVEFQDCEYPMGCGYINLLTYNRCVAKAIIVACNASKMSGPGNYKANALKVIDDLEQTGILLAAQIKAANAYFDQVSNTIRMASLVGVKDSGQCNVAYMKADGPTNVFFNSGQIVGVTVPVSNTTITPKNETKYVAAGKGQGYMAGYAPITILGKTFYGVPVFPQQTPHLVSLWDFNNAAKTFGAAPPNAVELGGHTNEMKTGLLTGAVACAIVGAVEQGSSGSGGTGVGQGLLGSGFQFPAAASYGYLEFGNYPANAAPPGYNPKDYQDNIFNHELYNAKGFLALGNNVNAQNSNIVAFGVDGNAVKAWVEYGALFKLAQAADAKRKPTDPPTTYPTAPSSNSKVYVGPQASPQLVTGTQQQIDWLATCILQEVAAAWGSPAGMCTLQLANKNGLYGACVAALPAMIKVYRPVPDLNPAGGSQNFSQADWAKAEMLTDFEGLNPKNAGGLYNNYSEVNLGLGPAASGLGIYPSKFVPNGTRVPNVPPNMPSPPNSLPLQSAGTIYDLICAVQQPACRDATVQSIIERCKQIQPSTTDQHVMDMLKGPPLQMADAGPLVPTWQNSRKLYIYLPNGDLSQSLIITPVPPPKVTNNAPDGCCSAPNQTACYTHQYGIDGSIVDSLGDQMVDQRPYLQIDGGLSVIDHADWQPGSGADNNFGRMTFQEIGIGKSTYTQIN